MLALRPPPKLPNAIVICGGTFPVCCPFAPPNKELTIPIISPNGLGGTCWPVGWDIGFGIFCVGRVFCDELVWVGWVYGGGAVLAIKWTVIPDSETY